MPSYSLIAVALAALLASALAGWQLYEHGEANERAACATQTAAANAKALTDWQDAADKQRAADAAARATDAERAKAATDAAQAVADRFEAMKIAVVKLPPAGTCDLSPKWVESFNAAH